MEVTLPVPFACLPSSPRPSAPPPLPPPGPVLPAGCCLAASPRDASLNEREFPLLAPRPTRSLPRGARRPVFLGALLIGFFSSSQSPQITLKGVNSCEHPCGASAAPPLLRDSFLFFRAEPLRLGTAEAVCPDRFQLMDRSVPRAPIASVSYTSTFDPASTRHATSYPARHCRSSRSPARPPPFAGRGTAPRAISLHLTINGAGEAEDGTGRVARILWS